MLDDVALSLAPGTLASLTGVNGVGKTTLLRIVGGLIAPDSGTVTVDGLAVESQRREYQRRIGLLTAGQTGLYARLGARHHLELWARIAFVPRPERRERVERALGLFGLDGFATKRADRLSTGQRQRLRLAMTFLHEPRLVLLDEPATSLDAVGIETLRSAVSTQSLA